MLRVTVRFAPVVQRDFKGQILQSLVLAQ